MGEHSILAHPQLKCLLLVMAVISIKQTVCEKDNVNDAILKPTYKIILPLTFSDSDSE